MMQPTKREQLAAMRLEEFKAHLRTIAGGSGLLTHIVATEGVSLCTRMKS
jgi:hypothetical protein